MNRPHDLICRRSLLGCDRINVEIYQINTHKPPTFYQFFLPAQAQAYLDRFNFHYTPKRGSWLNMAKIEIGIHKRHYLDRRIYPLGGTRLTIEIPHQPVQAVGVSFIDGIH